MREAIKTISGMLMAGRWRKKKAPHLFMHDEPSFEQTRQLRLQHVYLGYWIEQSPKMAYKAQFSPFECLIDGRWQATGESRS